MVPTHRFGLLRFYTALTTLVTTTVRYVDRFIYAPRQEGGRQGGGQRGHFYPVGGVTYFGVYSTQFLHHHSFVSFLGGH